MDDPVDVMLFMPEETFREIHAAADRLGITDSALFTATWRAARDRIDGDPAAPRLTSTSTGGVYFALAASVRDDALAFALSKDRSMSWAFLKAWGLVRGRVATLKSGEQLA